MKVVYRPAAIEDIQSTAAYIENELKNPQAAERFKERILYSVSLLKENPNMGIFLSDKYDFIKSDYRYIIVNKQIVFYEIYEDTIEVVRVLDGRTDYLTQLL
ncbi:MAG: type II toxin-antitoxin system RelE/ParE family toxin [Clostridia bacterium]|nr:type II toxin-antitoxin system RelE/ParE family toxin [Clostridia bacterium]